MTQIPDPNQEIHEEPSEIIDAIQRLLNGDTLIFDDLRVNLIDAYNAEIEYFDIVTLQNVEGDLPKNWRCYLNSKDKPIFLDTTNKPIQSENTFHSGFRLNLGDFVTKINELKSKGIGFHIYFTYLKR